MYQNNKNYKDIIEGLLCDNSQAMRRLFEMFYKPLCCYAVRYVSSMPIAEEIASDVMYKIWQNRHQGYRAETFSDYLYAATRNTALNYMKQQETRKKLNDNWAEQLRDELIEDSPLDKMITKEMLSKLEGLMDTLPEQCRRAFIMSRIDDMSYEEIAAQMNISVNTVKYHIKVALQKLRAGVSDILMWLFLIFWKFFVILFIHIPTLFLFSIVLIAMFHILYN